MASALSFPSSLLDFNHSNESNVSPEFMNNCNSDEKGRKREGKRGKERETDVKGAHWLSSNESRW